MNRTTKIIAVIVAAIAGLWLLSLPVQKYYLQPRIALSKSVKDSEARLVNYRKADEDRPRVNRELQAFVDRTLGGDSETVDHKLRTRLNRLAEHVQLQGATVGTGGAAKPRETPAKIKFSGSINKLLREEIDFAELEGWLSGAGTFEQVLRLVDSIEAEPWIKRIDQLKLDPRDNGGRFDVTVRLTTLFLPGRSPNPANVAAASAAGFDRYQALLSRQPFRVPPPPPPPPPKPKPEAMTDPTPPPPPAFPFEQWSVTGIAQSAKGAEVWLLNTQTHEAKRLTIGESLHDATLAATTTETAEFRVGQQRFLVAVGKNLGDRVPISQ